MERKNNNNIGTGFACPTIGKPVPQGKMLVQCENGRWQMVNKRQNAGKNKK